MNNDNDFFGTSDMPLVATLRCLGAVIDSVDRGSSRAVFYFKREKGLDALIQAFWAHELKVEPMAYFNALKEAKTRLYSH